MKFEYYMTASSGYTKNKALPREWSLIEELFNNRLPFGRNRIPKIIHQIWLGSDVNDTISSHIDTVKKANPDYQHMLWTDENIKYFDFKNKELFLSCRNNGQKSDILRYALLEEFGGIYLDTDFIGIKNFDTLLHHHFFTGVSYDSEPTLFNGLIGCVPNHNLVQELNNFDKPLEDYDGMAVIRTSGPWYLTRKLFKYIKTKDTDVIVLPLAYFYPFPNFDRDKVKGNDYKDYIAPETICVHLWDSRWN